MSNIHGVNFDNQTVTAKDHGRLFEYILEDGVLTGCALSFSGTSLMIAPGYLIAAGREMKLTASTTVTVDGATSGYARVLLTIDLTQNATTTEFEQAAFTVEYASSVAGFGALTRDDVNGSGTTYEFELCKLALGASGVASIYSSAGAATVRIPLISSGMLAADAVDTDAIEDSSVTTNKLADGAATVPKGGTGRSALTAYYLLVGNGASPVALIAPSTSGYVLMSNGASANPSFKAQTNITQVGTITSGVWNGSVIPLTYGGTGAATGALGLKNLLAAGITILSANQYGASLPAAGNAGRLFFKTV